VGLKNCIQPRFMGRGFSLFGAKILMRIVSSFLFLLLIQISVFGQGKQAVLKGRISTESGDNLPDAQVFISETNTKTESSSAGNYTIKIPAGQKVQVQVSRLGYASQFIIILADEGEILTRDFELKEANKSTADVNISENVNRNKVSTISFDPKIVRVLPSPFGDFNRVLALQPGVVANNELSSGYSVRGGNYDENLVYVNDMEVYRPQLVRSGQQEGLSFVNPDLVKSVEFSAGGWQPRFGDKMGSVLNVQYKAATTWASNVTASPLVQTFSIEGVNKNKRLSFVSGFRRKNARSLFGGGSILGQGFDIKGQYFPRFVDWQTYVEYNLSKDTSANAKSKTTLGYISSVADNKYELIPTTRETDYGTLSSKLRFSVAFDGKESMNYTTWQQGLRLSHVYNEKWRSDVTASYLYTREREIVDVEAGYRLCDVQSDPNKSNFNECISQRGVGTLYNYARNSFEARILQFINRNYVQVNSSHYVEFGVQASREMITDKLYAYSFVDSADFVNVTPANRVTTNVASTRMQGYVQDSWEISKITTVTYGLRGNYWTLNNQFVLSPRVQMSVKPNWNRNVVFRFASGVYVQPAFYRELRASDGSLNKNLKAQQSIHIISGLDYQFKMWDRSFKWTSEVWYKKMDHIVAYDVDNVRIRYFANNDARAWAWGIDNRIAGEFIPGAESWFGLSVLSTKEDLFNDKRGYYSRPTNQMVTGTIFFQDHLPNNPSVRAYLSLIYGTGLPFSVPGDINQRSAFVGPAYRRVDLGCSKIVSMGREGHRIYRHISLLQVGVDILNVLGTANTINYTWVKDFGNDSYAIPNTLSMRFINLKLIATLK